MLIAIKHVIRSSLVKEYNINSEQIYVEAQINGEKFIIGCVYFPPNSIINTYTQHQGIIEDLNNFYRKHRLIIIGDFNLPHTSWTNNPLNYTFLSNLDMNKRSSIFTVFSTYSQMDFDQYYPTLHTSTKITL